MKVNKIKTLACAVFISLFFVQACSEDDTLGTIVDNIAASPDSESFFLALQESDRDMTLRQSGPYTVFVPVDDVFAALPPGLFEQVLLVTPALRAILDYHIVYGDYDAAALQAMSGQKLTTLLGQTIEITSAENTVFVNDNPIILPDIASDNGHIHFIGGLLIPDIPEIQAILNP